MKLVVGLGNDGVKYAKTRHNVGFLVVDKLMGLDLPRGVVVAKSEGFINASGVVVARLKNYYKIVDKNLYIVHDDLDITLGEYKIQFGRGPKDHKGLNDIYEKLGNKNFWHVRVGVDNRNPGNRISGEEYVLQDFTQEEREVLNKVIKNLTNKLIV